MLIKEKLLFNKEECDKIISLSKTNLQKWSSNDRNFISNAIDYTFETNWLFDRLKTFFELETEIKILNLNSQIHFHKFIKGDWFEKHNDIRDARVYGIGVLLNDKFEGGDFKLYDSSERVLNKIIGNTYIFDVRIEHEITPILNGERYSLLWFLKKNHIKFKNTNSLI
jgi:hypothetical protein